VRGTKNPDRQAIVELRPDLVLAAKEENMLRDVRALEEAGIPVYVTNIRTVAEAAEQLGALARLLDAKAGAAPLLEELRAALWRVYALPADRVRRRVLVFIWRDPWMAVGDETYANDLLALCGADNVALRLPGRYPRAALSAFMQLNPEVILLPDEPYHFEEADWESFAPYGDVAAVLNRQVFLCDGKLLTWYGSRTAEALRLFGELLG
jgi:ABC-type Fe3+-hydroxamate transport system substrate-binding protein